jgi:LuxR family maltose regulon positive regulatory protein
MDAPLLTTKFYVPPVRPELVSRPRLIQRLGAGLHCRLTLICAPAGFGKTMLLSEWIEAEREVGKDASPTDTSLATPEFAWLSLDDEDNDPVRFFTYFIAALETVQADVGADARALLQSPKPPSLKSVLTLLINSLAAFQGGPSTSTRRRLVLVLDDYHVIDSGPIHDAITFFLHHMPANVNLVIASRVDPPLSLARLRTGGQLVELREADLRFTPDEAAAFLDQAMGINLTSNDVAALEARTEGWAAGLHLAALSMRGKAKDHVPEFIAAFSGSHRHVIDYLAEEVMAQQPEEIHDFLCQTAILDRLSAPLCNAVTVQEDSDAKLRKLDGAHLFLVPLDDRREWYRYHRLFADFLRSHLAQDMPDQIKDLHLRAAEWYQNNGLTAEAVGHALSAADFERAADLIEEVIEATLMRSEIATLESWVEALPDDIVRSRPRICVYQAWTLLLTGHPLEAAETRLEDAAQADATGSVSGEVAMFQALIATYQGETRRSAELAHEALRLLPEYNPFLRSLVAGFLGVNYLWSGDLVTAQRTLEEAARISQQAGNVMNAVLAICHLAEVAIIQGRLYEGQALYDRAVELAVDERGQPRPIAGVPITGLGSLLQEWNDLESAERHLLEGIELTRKWGEAGGISGYTHLARLKQAQGDADGARQAIQTAREIARNFDAMELDDLLVDVNQVRLWIAQGAPEAAMGWAEQRGLTGDAALDEVDKLARGPHVPLVRAMEYVTLAQVYIARDRPVEALRVIKPMLQAMERAGWTTFVTQLMALQALALQARGDTNQAIAVLARTLSTAEPSGFVRLFIDEGQPMLTLLRQAISHGIATGYVAKLLAAFEDETKDDGRKAKGRKLPDAPPSSFVFRHSSLDVSEVAGLIEPLSERELEVLGLIAAGLSNREIADQLVVAISTVKTHINNIYRKLDVSKRTQAVARGRELGLL